MSSWWPVRLASCSGLSSSESCPVLWKFHHERIKNLWILWMSSWWLVRLASCSGLSSSESCPLLWIFYQERIKNLWVLWMSSWWPVRLASCSGLSSSESSPLLCKFNQERIKNYGYCGRASGDGWCWPLGADFPALSHVMSSVNLIKKGWKTMDIAAELLRLASCSRLFSSGSCPLLWKLIWKELIFVRYRVSSQWPVTNFLPYWIPSNKNKKRWRKQKFLSNPSRIPDPRGQKQWIPDADPQHWLYSLIYSYLSDSITRIT